MKQKNEIFMNNDESIKCMYLLPCLIVLDKDRLFTLLFEYIKMYIMIYDENYELATAHIINIGDFYKYKPVDMA